jgi:hypothetical protein
VKAEATEEPIRIIGPSGPENRHADTVSIVPNSFTNTVLEATPSYTHTALCGRGAGKGGGGGGGGGGEGHLKRKRLGTWMPLR